MTRWEFPISDDEIRALNQARDVLDYLQERARKDWPEGKFENFMCGRIAESSERAEGALFSLLNMITNGGNRTMTYEQIHNSPEPDDEPEDDDVRADDMPSSGHRADETTRGRWEADARSPSLPDIGGLSISDPRQHTLKEEG